MSLVPGGAAVVVVAGAVVVVDDVDVVDDVVDVVVVIAGTVVVEPGDVVVVVRVVVVSRHRLAFGLRSQSGAALDEVMVASVRAPRRPTVPTAAVMRRSMRRSLSFLLSLSSISGGNRLVNP
jgi:hypothetical protein